MRAILAGFGKAGVDAAQIDRGPLEAVRVDPPQVGVDEHLAYGRGIDRAQPDSAKCPLEQVGEQLGGDGHCGARGHGKGAGQATAASGSGARSGRRRRTWRTSDPGSCR